MKQDILWSRFHQEVVDQVVAFLCEQCLQSGKSLKYMLRQNQIGKITEAKEENEDVALDFAGLFQHAEKSNC